MSAYKPPRPISEVKIAFSGSPDKYSKVYVRIGNDWMEAAEVKIYNDSVRGRYIASLNPFAKDYMSARTLLQNAGWTETRNGHFIVKLGKVNDDNV